MAEAAATGAGDAEAGVAGADEAPGRMYLSTLAVEDLREYDALLLAMLLLLVGLFLSARCSRTLTTMRDARAAGRANDVTAAVGGVGGVGDNAGDARRRKKARQKRQANRAAAAAAGGSSSSEAELDDLAAEEQAFLDSV